MDKFIKVCIYVGMKDKDNRASNKEMVPYTALFDKFCRDNLSAYTDSATIYDAQGMWKGASEGSKVIEILVSDGKDALLALVNTMATDLKFELNQEAVLITTQVVLGVFI